MGRLDPLPAGVRPYGCLVSADRVVRRVAPLLKGATFFLDPGGREGASPFVEVVAVGRYPLLWGYARAETAFPAGVDHPAVSGHPTAVSAQVWRVLEHYATEEPRKLPLAAHLRMWDPSRQGAAGGRRLQADDPPCPRCGEPMRRRGEHGPFWGCRRYPACTGNLPGTGE